jgi:hypothetical protein
VIAADISSLARMIKNKRPHVPIILMTAHPSYSSRRSRCPAPRSEIAELCRAIKVRLAQ